MRAHLGRLPRAPFHDGRVVLVSREAVTDVAPVERVGFQQPVVLIDHSGGPADLTESVSSFEKREAGVVVATPVHRPA